MPNFGVSATQMSAPAVAGRIRQPVADTSGVELLSSVLQQVPEALYGANLAQLDIDIQGTAEAYRARDIAPEQAELGMAQAAGQRKVVESIWDTFDEVNMDTVNKLETSISSNLKKYKTAYEQGRMSSEELLNRVNSITKSAIARQPGLGRELIAQAEYYQNLAGVTDQLAAAKAFEKDKAAEADQRLKYENKVLADAGVDPYRVGGAQREQALAEAHEQIRRAQTYNRFLKGADVLSKKGELTQQMVDQALTAPEETLGRAASLLQTSATVSNNLTSNAYVAQYKEQGLSGIDANLRGITEHFSQEKAKLATVGALAGEKGRRVVDAQVKQLEDMEKLYKDVASGGPAATAAQNALSARQATLKLSTASLEHRLNLANQWSSTLGNLSQLGMQLVDPATARNLIGPLTLDMQDFTAGFGRSPLETLDYTNKEGQVVGKFIFSSQNPVDDPLRTPDEVIKANDNTMINNLRMLQATSDPTKFMQSLDMWTQTVVQEAASSGEPLSTRYSPEVVTKINTFFGDAFNNARTSGKLSYDKGSNSFRVVNEDGSVNTDRTKRINTMFKAFISFNDHKLDAKIDEVAETLQSVANWEGGEKALKEKSAGAVKPGQLTEKELKAIDIDLPAKSTGTTSLLVPNMQITSEMQAERDATRIRVLQMELDAYKQKAISSTDPEKQKLYNDNIRYVTEELKQLGVGQ